MAEVEIYTTMLCPFCFQAKALLKSKGVAYNEIRTDMDMGKRNEMIKRAGGQQTVPQIFIDDRHIGGCDDLVALDQQGALGPLLAG